jgi:2,4-dienoyl-CoA reductase-like NADH-dependent reductase (Old Yellow Enzyme family)
MFDGMEGGLTVSDGVQVAAKLRDMGIDGVELSGGMGGERSISIINGIRAEKDEAYFRPLAKQVRTVTDLPILLVGGLRSRNVMEAVLRSGDADFISLCRPLISEPDLPKRLRAGTQNRSRCISGDRCWADESNQGISCKCKIP